jgi:hypothetical protein
MANGGCKTDTGCAIKAAHRQTSAEGGSVRSVVKKRAPAINQGEPETGYGATARSRTADLRITSALLYQLSYGG